jgi:hypothetical protein
MQFSIYLLDETPIYWRRHRLSKHEWKSVDERCKKFHEAGFIQPSSFDFTSIILANKKRIHLDYGLKKDVWGL